MLYPSKDYQDTEDPAGGAKAVGYAPGILGRQRSSLASATFITSLRSVAITIRMMSELMTPVVLKTPAACEISKPTPAGATTTSPTTAPISTKATPRLRPAKIPGVLQGGMIIILDRQPLDP